MVTCLVAGATGAVGQQIVRLLVTNMAVSSVVVLTRRAVPAAGEAAAWARENLGLTDDEQAKKIVAVHVSEADWEHDDVSMSALDVVARDFAAREQAWLQTLLKSPAPAAILQAMHGVDVVFTAMGSSRANPETQAAQAATSYHEGFATWLRRVDCSQNIKLAQAARAANAKGFVRVSAMSSNANSFGTPEQYWGWYARYQGIADDMTEAVMGSTPCVILNPGGLDRGDKFRINRPWEIQRHQTGPGMPVARVAERAVADGLAFASGAGSGSRRVSHSEL